MTIDLCFCKYILSDGIAIVRQHGITSNYLFDDGKTVFDYLLFFYEKFSTLPNPDTILKDTKIDINAVQAPEPLEYYVEKLRHRHLSNTISEHVKKAVKSVTKGKIDDAIEEFKTGLKNVQEISMAGGKQVMNLTDNTLDRYVEYSEMADSAGLVGGIQTPWFEFDKLTGGYRPGEFWIAVARTKTGKSWLAILLMHFAWASGYKVLLVTMENPRKMMGRRFDAVSAKLPAGDFRHGTLGVHGEKRYIEYLENLSGKEPVFVVGAEIVRTPLDVEMIAKELDVDFIVIDGVYLMNPSYGKPKTKYERVSTVADELQNLPLRLNVPILCTTQFNRKLKEGALSGSANLAGFAYELMQNAHGVIGMFTNEDLKLSRRMILTVMENREGETGSMMVKWDLDTMEFDFIGMVDEEDLIPVKGKKSNKSGKKSSGGPIVAF